MTNQAIKEITFSDLSLNLIPHPITGSIKINTNADAIKQSVKNIVLTNFYEKPFNPFFGGNVTSHLFNNFSEMTESDIKSDVERSILNQEPRVSDLLVTVHSDIDHNGFSITIKFTPINLVTPVTIDIFLQRVR